MFSILVFYTIFFHIQKLFSNLNKCWETCIRDQFKWLATDYMYFQCFNLLWLAKKKKGEKKIKKKKLYTYIYIYIYCNDVTTNMHKFTQIIDYFAAVIFTLVYILAKYLTISFFLSLSLKISYFLFKTTIYILDNTFYNAFHLNPAM